MFILALAVVVGFYVWGYFCPAPLFSWEMPLPLQMAPSGSSHVPTWPCLCGYTLLSPSVHLIHSWKCGGKLELSRKKYWLCSRERSWVRSDLEDAFNALVKMTSRKQEPYLLAEYSLLPMRPLLIEQQRVFFGLGSANTSRWHTMFWNFFPHVSITGIC